MRFSEGPLPADSLNRSAGTPSVGFGEAKPQKLLCLTERPAAQCFNGRGIGIRDRFLDVAGGIPVAYQSGEIDSLNLASLFLQIGREASVESLLGRSRNGLVDDIPHMVMPKLEHAAGFIHHDDQPAAFELRQRISDCLSRDFVVQQGLHDPCVEDTANNRSSLQHELFHGIQVIHALTNHPLDRIEPLKAARLQTLHGRDGIPTTIDYRDQSLAAQCQSTLFGKQRVPPCHHANAPGQFFCDGQAAERPYHYFANCHVGQPLEIQHACGPRHDVSFDIGRLKSGFFNTA